LFFLFRLKDMQGILYFFIGTVKKRRDFELDEKISVQISW